MGEWGGGRGVRVGEGIVCAFIRSKTKAKGRPTVGRPSGNCRGLMLQGHRSDGVFDGQVDGGSETWIQYDCVWCSEAVVQKDRRPLAVIFKRIFSRMGAGQEGGGVQEGGGAGNGYRRRSCLLSNVSHNSPLLLCSNQVTARGDLQHAKAQSNKDGLLQAS